MRVSSADGTTNPICIVSLFYLHVPQRKVRIFSTFIMVRVINMDDSSGGGSPLIGPSSELHEECILMIDILNQSKDGKPMDVK